MEKPKPSLTIKIANRNDIEAVIDLIRDVYTEYGFIFKAEEETPDLLTFDQTYDQTSGVFFVGSIDKNIVGSIGLKWVEPTTLEIYRLYLMAHFRGLGLGRQLLETAIVWAREHQACRMILWSDTRFIDAHKLYTRAGFIQSAERYLADINDTREYQFMLEL